LGQSIGQGLTNIGKEVIKDRKATRTAEYLSELAEDRPEDFSRVTGLDSELLAELGDKRRVKTIKKQIKEMGPGVVNQALREIEGAVAAADKRRGDAQATLDAIHRETVADIAAQEGIASRPPRYANPEAELAARAILSQERSEELMNRVRGAQADNLIAETDLAEQRYRTARASRDFDQRMRELQLQMTDQEFRQMQYATDKARLEAERMEAENENIGKPIAMEVRPIEGTGHVATFVNGQLAAPAVPLLQAAKDYAEAARDQIEATRATFEAAGFSPEEVAKHLQTAAARLHGINLDDSPEAQVAAAAAKIEAGMKIEDPVIRAAFFAALLGVKGSAIVSEIENPNRRPTALEEDMFSLDD
jgi:hypothetical protein